MFKTFAATITVFVTLASLSAGPGPLAVWGTSTDPLVLQGGPAGDFVSLAAGGALQTLALRADCTLYLSSSSPVLVPPIPAALDGVPFAAVGMGRTHGLAIRPDGSIVAWPDSFQAGAPTAGRFVAVTAGSFHSVALDSDGHVALWAHSGLSPAEIEAVVDVGAPAGMTFTAIAARSRYTLALGTDGNVYGWGVNTLVFDQPSSGWASDHAGHFVAPRDAGERYVAIAAGLGPTAGALILALRADGTVASWSHDAMPEAPAPFRYSQIAAGLGYGAAIDESGQLRGWGAGASAVLATTPPGFYSALSAATSHATAIAGPDTTAPVVTAVGVDRDTLWPVNHKMATVRVTFRADDTCAPVARSAVSVAVRSNQQDNGSGSGDTTGDTNGGDGYSGAVLLPESAVVENLDGSFTATFELRAERSAALDGPRIYTVSITARDDAGNVSPAMTAQVAVMPD